MRCFGFIPRPLWLRSRPHGASSEGGAVLGKPLSGLSVLRRPAQGTASSEEFRLLGIDANRRPCASHTTSWPLGRLGTGCARAASCGALVTRLVCAKKAACGRLAVERPDSRAPSVAARTAAGLTKNTNAKPQVSVPASFAARQLGQSGSGCQGVPPAA